MLKSDIKGFVIKALEKIKVENSTNNTDEKLSLDKKDIYIENDKKDTNVENDIKEFLINVESNEKYSLNIYSNVIDIDIRYNYEKEFKIYVENYKNIKNKEKLTFEVDNIKNNINVNLIYKGIDICNNSVNISGRNNSISISSSKNSECDNLNGVKLIILVPKLDSILSNIDIKTISSDISIKELKCDEYLKISSTSGNINLKKNNSKEIEISSISGDIFVDTSLSGTLKLKTTSGDITCENTDSKILICNSVSGDIDICKCSGKDMKLRSTSGDLLLSNIKYKSVDLSSISGDISLNNKSILEYKIEKFKTKTMSGKERIFANYEI